MKPGNENTEVTETVAKIGEAFECKVSADDPEDVVQSDDNLRGDDNEQSHGLIFTDNDSKAVIVSLHFRVL